jgi:hypothetical protein
MMCLAPVELACIRSRQSRPPLSRTGRDVELWRATRTFDWFLARRPGLVVRMLRHMLARERSRATRL